MAAPTKIAEAAAAVAAVLAMAPATAPAATYNLHDNISTTLSDSATVNVTPTSQTNYQQTDDFLFDFGSTVPGLLTVAIDPNTNNNLPLAQINSIDLYGWNTNTSAFSLLQAGTVVGSPSGNPTQYSATFSGPLSPGPRTPQLDYMLRIVATDLSGQKNGSQYELTVAAVPEPAEWALMLGGLGLVGWAARRRTTAR